jgi:hypothetical protein
MENPNLFADTLNKRLNKFNLHIINIGNINMVNHRTKPEIHFLNIQLSHKTYLLLEKYARRQQVTPKLAAAKLIEASLEIALNDYSQCYPEVV